MDAIFLFAMDKDACYTNTYVNAAITMESKNQYP